MEKPKHKLMENMGFIFSQLWNCDKRLTVYMLLRSPLLVICSFWGIYLSKEIVSMVEKTSPPMEIVVTVSIISLLLALSLAAEKFLSASLEKLMQLFDVKLQCSLIDILARGDYENNESAAGLARFSKAMENCGSDNRGARLISSLISSVLANIIGVFSYAMLLFNFSSVILLVITATTVGSFFLLNLSSKWSYNNKDKWKPYDRKIDYLLQCSGDFSKAKDIRLYGLGEWLSDVFASALTGRMSWSKKEQLYNFRADWLRALLSLFRDVISYGLLVYLLQKNNMSSADFVMYFGIMGGFATWLSGIANDFSNIFRFHLTFSEMREFMEYPNKVNRAEGIPLPLDSFEIEFKNVCYRHEGNNSDTIKDLSFKISKGEKLAIVGVNGAGKTTVVKLICGLYTPSSGEILIDGAPINAYNREGLFSLFAVVFQDVFVLPQSVATNVAGGEYKNMDINRVKQVLARAGLYEKITTLPKGLDTRLVKTVHEDGIDLSGGELQKLALARALYKGGKALILDEPTAALDPIAESKIYNAYKDMTMGHSSVFISHRLASTRFCDRIFMLEQGRIIEEGTHESLIKKQGKYFEMFEMQSHYYKEQVPEYEF